MSEAGIVEELRGGYGKAITLVRGRRLRIENTFGSQVVDTWALNQHDTSEYLSLEHTRRMLGARFPKTGDTLYSNRRTPLLLLEDDTSPGRHDMLLACCDKWLYKHYGCPTGHRNCRDNFLEALFEAGFDATLVPNPLNLWMNIPVTTDGAQSWGEPLSKPGDYVVLRAEMDCIVAMSACPQDILPINGTTGKTVEAHFTIDGA